MRRLARGPRPWPIRAFAVIVLGFGIAVYVSALRDLAGSAQDLARLPGGFLPDRDQTIVILSARLTIVAIPVAAIWFLASTIARWLVTIMLLASLPGTLLTIIDAAQAGTTNGHSIAGLIVGVASIALLFTRPARDWFSRGRQGDDARHR
jgi:hypothetical protein